MNRYYLLLFTFTLALFTACTKVEEFKFQVTIPPQNGVFAIPLSGRLDEVWDKPYHWKINWGDGTKQTVSNLDIDAPQNAMFSKGISKKYKHAGNYTITITPAGSTDAWLAAFGFCNSNTGANSWKNKEKFTKVISPLTPLMTRTQAQINSGEAPNSEWRDTFIGCGKLIMGEGFTFSGVWNKIETVGSNFARSMFYSCSRSAFTMNSIFNLPVGLTSVGDGFAFEMFANCSGASFNMNNLFNLPAGITNVGDGFAGKMFFNCPVRSSTGKCII